MSVTIPSPLSTFAILAQSGITSTSGTTIINGGNYGNAGGASQITGTYGGTGINDQSASLTVANIQLGTLIGNITTATSGMTPVSISGASGTTVNYLPNNNYNSASSITYDTNAIIRFVGNATDQFFITAGSTITFTNVTIELIGAVQFSNIFWLAGTAITFTGVPNIYGNLIAQTGLISLTSTNVENSYIYTKGTQVTFGGANTVVVCYVKGTNILTPNGYVKIEDLTVGDKVVTKGSIVDNKTLELKDEDGEKSIVWIGTSIAFNMKENSLPIRIKANTFGLGVPSEDLRVSPPHRIFVDGKMVTAIDLINGDTIIQETETEPIEYYHLELEEHSAIVANGLLSESFFDNNCRHLLQEK
jgi:hypothetical protein